MAWMNNAVGGEGMSPEEEAASTPYGGGQTVHGIARVSNLDGERSLYAPGGQQLAHMHSYSGGRLLGKLRRGVAAEST
jgi:hypothetical protein